MNGHAPGGDGRPGWGHRALAVGVAAVVALWCASVPALGAAPSSVAPSPLASTPPAPSPLAPVTFGDGRTTAVPGGTPSGAVDAATRYGSAQRGVAIFGEHCAGCHGPLGAGDGPLVDRLPAPPPSLADAGRMGRWSAEDIWSTVTNGRLENGMPPFSRLLSDAERWDVVALVRAFGDQHPLRLVAGGGAFARDCAACHADRDALASGIDAAALSASALSARYGAVAEHGAAALAERTIGVALAWLAAAGSQPLPLPGAALGGRIAGRVQEGIAGEPADGRAVTMTLSATALGLRADLGAVPVAPDGRFAVDDLVVGDGIVYEPEAFFDGVGYRPKDALTLTVRAPLQDDVSLRVFPADPTVAVHVAGISGLAKASPERGEIGVFEVWQIANDSDRTRVASGGPTFRLPLPIGARDVVLEDRTGRADLAAMTGAGEGWLSCAAPVPPGGLEVVVTYAMPYRGTTATLERTLVDGAQEVGWVLADEGAEAGSPQLGMPQPDSFGGQPVTRYVGGRVAPGERWTVAVRGLPPATSIPGSAQDVLGPAAPAAVSQAWLARLALLGAAAAMLAVLAFGAGAGKAGLSRTAGGAANRRGRAYDGAVTAIAQLDARFDRGELAPNAYQRRRAALVARAWALYGSRPAAAGVRPTPPPAPPTGEQQEG